MKVLNDPVTVNRERRLYNHCAICARREEEAVSCKSGNLFANYGQTGIFIVEK